MTDPAAIETKQVNGQSDVKPPQEWKSCCFRLQPQAATFSVQVFFSSFLVFFSAYKLLNAGLPDPLYVSLLTTTVGVWLPSPLHALPALVK